MNWKALALSGLAAVSALAPATQAQNLEAVLVASGFSNPLYAISPPGDTARLFIVEQNSGRIKIIKNGNTLSTPFIDVGSLASGGGERGLLGLAFHPDYSVSGAAGERMFVINYTNNSGSTVVRSYRASASNPDVADAASFTTLLTLSQPFSNHNGGCVQFGPDKMLYIGTGDGGSGNDPGNRSQNTTNLLGKMLRLDPTIPAPFVPADNPFVGNGSVSNEIWSIGLRNPWRFTFDRDTGDMWIADVGQNAREEINFEPAGAGGLNYGWRCMEAGNCTGLSGCTCNSAALTMPVDSYGHGGGNCSISGGFRYRGSAMPNFAGRYFYADLCSDNIWSVDFNGSAISNKVNHKTDLGLPSSVTIASFGEDANGELYICDLGGGRIYRIQEECVSGSSSYCVAGTNSTGGTCTLSAQGSTSLSDNSFALAAVGAPSGIPGLFFYGPSQTQQVFGDGFRCVSGQVFRMPPVTVTDIFGIAIGSVDFTTPPESTGNGQITPGSTWNYQFWYRDVANNGAGFNLSDGLQVSFCP